MFGVFPASPKERRISWADLHSDDDSCSESGCTWNASATSPKSTSPTGSTAAASNITGDASATSPKSTSPASTTVAASNSGSATCYDTQSRKSEVSVSLQVSGDREAPTVGTLAAQLQTLAEAAKERAAEAEAKASRVADKCCGSELDSDILERRENASALQETLREETRTSQVRLMETQMHLRKAQRSQNEARMHGKALVDDLQSTQAQAQVVNVEIQGLIAEQEDLGRRLALAKDRAAERERGASESLSHNVKLQMLQNQLQSAQQEEKELKAATEEARAALNEVSQRRIDRAAASKQKTRKESPKAGEHNKMSELKEEAEVLRLELDAPTAAGLRAEGLRHRIEELNQKLSAVRSEAEITGRQTQVPSNTSASEFDEAAVQAKNQRLAEELRTARARRDAAQAAGARVADLRLEIKAERDRCAHSRKEVASLQRQAREASDALADAQRNMGIWSSRVQTLEDAIRAAESAAQQEIEKHRKNTVALEQMRQGRRRAEDQEQLLAWKLKATASQLHALGKSAAARRLGLSLVRPLTASQRLASKTHKALNKAALRTLSEDSDAGTSTTAGEPASDADASSSTPCASPSGSCADGAVLKKLWHRA